MAAVGKVTAKEVANVMEDHLIKHGDVFDPMLKKHDYCLYGEKGDNGMVKDMNEVKAGYGTMKAIGIAIFIALLANIAVAFIK